MAELNCYEKTDHYSDKLTLLKTYDADGDGFIVKDDCVRISQDYFDGKVSQAETFLVMECFDKYGGDISKMCPSASHGFDCARCDFNHDGVVDINETILLGAAFGSRPGDAKWNPIYDLNGDGVIDHKDLGILGSCMGPVAAPPEPGCVTEGAYTVDRTMVCRGGKWVPVSTPPAPECKEGDKKAGYVCSGGKWVPVSTPPAPGPEVPPAPGPEVPPAPGPEVPVPEVPVPGAPAKYLTPDEALLRIRAGEKCYIKCTLPLLNMLPGIPYTQGIPVLPGFAITIEP